VRTSVVPSLAWARLRYRPLRRFLVVLGVAAATALPVAAQASAQVVASQAVRYGVQALPPGQRSLIASFSGVELSDADLAAVDHRSRTALATLATGDARRELLYRRAADRSGGTFFLGAADDLPSAVRVSQGRLPASCTPERCEVVVVGSGTPDLDPALGLVVVGRAVRTDPLLLTGTFDPGHDAPLLLADGVAKAQQLASLQLFQRSYGWVAPLDFGVVQRLGVEAYLQRSAATTDELSAFRTGLVITSPDATLRAEDARARLSARRFTLLGASATVLLLGFCVIAATGLRRDRLALDGLLRRRGASRRTVRLLAAVEAVVPVSVGTVLGLALGAVVGAVTAARAGLPAAATAVSAVGAALAGVLLGALMAAVVVAVTSSWAGSDERTAWRVVDATVVVGLAVVALSVARGTVGAATLDAGNDPLLTALPVLVVLCGGLLAARLWPAGVTLLGRAVPHRWVAARLALLGGARRPLRPVATVAFLTAATAVVVFAGSYRSTLAQGAVDQAAFTVPLSARVTTGSTLERPLDVAASKTFAALAPGVAVRPVVRSAAGLRLSATEAVPVEVIGVDPSALPEVRSWAHVVGGGDPAAAAAAIRVPRTPVGQVVPAGAARFVLPVSGQTADVQLTAWFRPADGQDVGVAMTEVPGGFVAALPAELATGDPRFQSFTLAEATDVATRVQHHIGEGLTSLGVLGGRMLLGPARFVDGSGGRLADGSWTGWGATSASNSVTATVRGSSLAVQYAFTGDRLVVRAAATTPEPPLPVLVDAATAAHAVGSELELALTSGPPVTARIVGVLARFPTVGDSFVVADEGALADRLDSRLPGAGSVVELWIAGPDSSETALATALSQGPFDQLEVDLRSADQARLAADPLARGAAGLLVVSAVLALAVAVLAVVLLVVADRRDEAAELYAWESDGVAPRTLRTSLFVRAVAVVALAVPAGLLLGLVLARATAAIVTVTAVGTTPHPPLALSVGPAWVAAVLGAGFLVALAAAAIVASGSLREAMPRPPDTVLR
jgi:hypothetical protein